MNLLFAQNLNFSLTYQDKSFDFSVQDAKPISLVRYFQLLREQKKSNRLM